MQSTAPTICIDPTHKAYHGQLKPMRMDLRCRDDTAGLRRWNGSALELRTCSRCLYISLETPYTTETTICAHPPAYARTNLGSAGCLACLFRTEQPSSSPAGCLRVAWQYTGVPPYSVRIWKHHHRVQLFLRVAGISRSIL